MDLGTVHLAPKFAELEITNFHKKELADFVFKFFLLNI